MTDIESRLRTMDLRPPRHLQTRALAGAGLTAANPRSRRLLPAVVAAILAALLAGYGVLAFTNAPPTDAPSTSGYGVGQGCWFIKDAHGLRFHMGGWYHGLPALCTSERRDSTPGP
jgi:hypothetical protein